jgi:ATP-binding cassette, subfamily C (CFTR/MRP), member 1
VIFQLSAFATYVIFAIISLRTGKTLDTGMLFASLSALKLITTPLVTTLQVIPALITGIASLERIQTFLLCAQHDPHDSNRENGSILKHAANPQAKFNGSEDDTKTENTVNPRSDGIELTNLKAKHDLQEPLIAIHDACFEIDPGRRLLSSIDIRLLRGTFTMVVGKVASGKSVLLQSLIGETTLSAGTISVTASGIAYCAQTVWLSNTTLRANICGEEDFEKDWYSRVTWACGLHKDFTELRNSDLTLIGSKGVSLSGGQKNRIALARAIYARKSLLVADDVLSGLDKATEKQVFDRVFGQRGLLRSSRTTVVLATHSTHFMPETDQVVVMESGRIALQGPYNKVATRLDCRDLIYQNEKPPVSDLDVCAERSALDEPIDESPVSSLTEGTASEDEEYTSADRRQGDLRCLLYFLAAIGIKHVGLSALGTMSHTIAQTMQFVYLKWWAESPSQEPDDTRRNIGIFTAITIASTIITAIGLTHYTLWLMPISSRSLHAKQLNALMRATYSFIVSVDLGQITNRFSQDILLVDQPLPSAWLNFVVGVYDIISQIVLITIATPPVAALIPFLGAGSWIVQRVYLRTSRQIRLMDLEAKAPLCTHFLETLAGITTVRAFGWSHAYREKNAGLLNDSQIPFYLLMAIQNWLKLVLELMVAGVVVVLVGLAVALRRKVDPGFLGLALVSAVSTTVNEVFLIWFVC